MNTPRVCPECGKPVPPNGLQGLCPECMMKVGVARQTAETGPGGAPTSKPTPPPPPPAEVSRQFPQLEILECLGHGGMGAVYKARQRQLDRVVALKILTRDPTEATREASFAERFEREARALARLNHPNIVTIYEFGQVSGLPYFIMEFVNGLNLRQLERAGKLAPREALQIIPQICEALQFAHDEGIVHRDIKPENILLDKKGRVKIADFGIAKILGRSSELPALTAVEQVIGTPHYMAPEQMERPQTVDHRADIYSLGVVFYEMLTGELPLGKFQPPSARIRGVQVDVRLDEVILRALEQEPERRYQHVSQVRTEVETIARTETGAQRDHAFSVEARRAELERGRWLIVAAGLVLCLAGVVMGFTSPARFGIPIVLWGVLGFIIATTNVVRSSASPEQDLAAVRAARKVILVDGLGICLAGLFVASRSAGLARPFAIFIGLACCLGLVACVLRLCGIEPLPPRLFRLVPATPAASSARGPGLSGGDRRLATVAARVGLVFGCLVFLTAAVITFLLPESFMSAARIALSATPGQAEAGSARAPDPYFIQSAFERIRSPQVLNRVIARLNLEERWGQRHGRDERLATTACFLRLQQHLDVRMIRSTSLLDIRVFSEDPSEAAELANAIAETYCSQTTTHRAEIVDRAAPGLRPVRPNWPLNLAWGAALGAVLGLIAGGLTRLLVGARGGHPASSPAASGSGGALSAAQAVRPWPHAAGLWLGLLVLGLVLLLLSALAFHILWPVNPNADRMVAEAAAAVATVQPIGPAGAATAATNEVAVLQLQLARSRLAEVRNRVEVGMVPPLGREVLDAELAVAVGQAELRDDRLAAAQARLNHARQIALLTQKLREVGKATQDEVAEARLAEAKAGAQLRELERQR